VTETVNKGGRPSKYKPEFCEQMIKFFDRNPVETIEAGKLYDKEGNVTKTLTKEVACQCPTFEKYCADIGISKQTFHNWVKEHEMFLDAYLKSKNFQANIMMVNGMSGMFNPGFTGLSMKNMHNWSDKQEIENTHIVRQMPTVKLNGDDIEFDVGDAVLLEDKEGKDD